MSNLFYFLVGLTLVANVSLRAEVTVGDLLKSPTAEETAPKKAPPLLPTFNGPTSNAKEIKESDTKPAPQIAGGLLAPLPLPTEQNAHATGLALPAGVLTPSAEAKPAEAKPAQPLIPPMALSADKKEEKDDEEEEKPAGAPKPQLFKEASNTNVLTPAPPTAAPAVAPTASSAGKIQIKKYRFQFHRNDNFERLVVEFKEKTKPVQPVTVQVTPTKGGNQIAVESVGLEGAIPEVKINKLFRKSRYLGEISFDADNPVRFNVTVKNKGSLVDAFWLESPNRLVIDSYPAGSPRSNGMAFSERVASSRVPASTGAADAPPPPESDKTLREPNAGDPNFDLHEKNKKPGLADKFACYLAGSQVQVTAAMIFKPATRTIKGKPHLRVEVDGAPSALPDGVSPDDIVCYPKTSRSTARVYYGSVHDQKVAPISASAERNLTSEYNIPSFAAPSAPVGPASPAGLFGGSAPIEEAALPLPAAPTAAPLGKLPSFK